MEPAEVLPNHVGHVFTCGMSRSGTTLLTTILDSHPDISMGYELLPHELPPTARLISLIRSAMEAAGDHPRKCGNLIKGWGYNSAGVFVKRCARTLVDPKELLDILEELQTAGHAHFAEAQARAVLSMAVVKRKRDNERTRYCGFKVTPSIVPLVNQLFADSRFFCIIRDPRDVVASHIANDFKKSVRQITHSWNACVDTFRRLRKTDSVRATLIRYEDLVTNPQDTLRTGFSQADIPYAGQVLGFYRSKASVHRPGQHHVNSENLRRDFFSTSVGRWRRELDDDQVEWIERACWDLMSCFDYPRHRASRRGILTPLLARVVPRVRNLLGRE